MTSQVGRYTIVSQLGKGAMGVVYLADDPRLHRQVAIKTIELTTDDEQQRAFLRNRLLRDAQAAAVLSHPHIVAVYDVIEEEHAAYVVMEYIAGESLAARLRREPSQPPAFTLRVLREMAAALDYTHAHGVIHRDVKPGNIMIDASGAAKIMDFGIARIVDSQTNTPTGMVMGTIQYMAPEQIKGEPVDGRADQFALAAVAYEMLTGKLMFGAQSMATLAYKIVHEDPAPARSLNISLPMAVDAVLARALAKNPADRFAKCEDFAAALGAAFSDAPPITAPAYPPATTLAGPVPAGSVATKRSRVPALALAGILAAGVGALVWKPWAAAPEVAISAVPPAQPPAPQQRVVRSTVTATSPAGKPQAKKAEANETTRPTTPTAGESDRDDMPPQPDAPPTGETPASRPAVNALNQGRALVGKGQFAAAIPFLDKALTLQPDWIWPHLPRGMARYRVGDYEGAVRDLSEFLRYRPKNALAYLYRGNSYVHLQQDDRALPDFNRSLDLNPRSAQVWVSRGNVFARRGQPAQAARDFSEAIRLAPDKPAAYLGRARARQALGDMAGARADRERARLLGAS